MKYLLLALLLAGCGSGGGTTVIDTVEEIAATEHICPDCNGTVIVDTQYITVTEYVTEYIDPYELDENDTKVYMTLWTKRKDLKNYQLVQRGIADGILISQMEADINITDDNGTTIIEGYFPIEDDDVRHSMSFVFEQGDVAPVLGDN